MENGHTSNCCTKLGEYDENPHTRNELYEHKDPTDKDLMYYAQHKIHRGCTGFYNLKWWQSNSNISCVKSGILPLIEAHLKNQSGKVIPQAQANEINSTIISVNRTPPLNRCTCGAKSIGWNNHSSWCDWGG